MVVPVQLVEEILQAHFFIFFIQAAEGDLLFENVDPKSSC